MENFQFIPTLHIIWIFCIVSGHFPKYPEILQQIMSLLQKLSGFAKTFRSALLTRWRGFSDSARVTLKSLMADICALMPTLHLNVFTFCKQLQKFSVILRSQKLVKPGKHLAVFEPCNSRIPFFNRKLVYLSIKCRDCLLLLTTFQYFSPFQKMWLPALFLKDQVHVSVSINHILIFFSFPEN